MQKNKQPGIRAGRLVNRQEYNRQTDKEKDTETGNQRDRPQAKGQTIRPIGRQTFKRTIRQTGRQTMSQLIMTQKVCIYGTHRVWNKKNSTLFMDKLHTSVEE